MAGSGGLVLAIDTATPAVTAALARVTADGVTVLASEVTVDARAHGERLAPAVRAVLERAEAAPADLVAVVAGTGPGPFTGLRVGLVTAVATAQALDIPGYGVCSLDGIGARAGAGTVLVATDARRREVYWARYADGRRLGEPRVDRPAEALAAATADGAPDRAAGDGATRYAEVFALPVTGPRYPEPAALVEAAAERILAGAPGEPLTPRYLRRPDVTMSGAPKPVLP